MQDFCFKTSDKALLISALTTLGLTAEGQVLGDFFHVGRVIATPGVAAADGSGKTAPVYYEGEYAIFRATDKQTAILEAATFPYGVEIVDPPAGIPMFGGEWKTPDLEALKQAACLRIDGKAETLRQALVTPGTGQMAVYQYKETQARALLQDPTPTEIAYPDIFNEVGITAETAQDVAMAVLAAAEKWHLRSRALEKVRLAGKQAVNNALNKAAILAAEEAIVWPEDE